MSDSALVAHSLAEGYLYWMVQPCAACGQGPMAGGEAVSTRTEGPLAFVSLPAVCGACGRRETAVFQVPREHLKVDRRAGRISDTAEPSRIIDVGQWIVLARMISEAAGRSDDKFQVRRFGIQAGHCLDEALKFYPADEDLPGAEAFFSSPSRERFREHPEQFAKVRILEMRAKLPAASKFADKD